MLAKQGIAFPEHKSPGILVLAVEPGSPVDTAGIAPGDVLLEIQRKPIESIDGLFGLTRGQNTALVGFWRGTTMQLAAVGGLNQP
jgi:S1-C subfamily serine protease